jgi:predicted RNase H-like HicB family nuclease
MRKRALAKIKNKQFPVIVEKDEDGFYVIECPIFSGCYSDGKTLDEALKNIKEVIELCLEEKENQKILKSYRPKELSLHTITL